MTKINVLNKKGDISEFIELKDEIFKIKPNISSIHSVIVMQLANKRQGTHSTLTRSEVSGGGKKPWKQKGTGRARVGSSRNPIWRKGGITFGPKPRTYNYNIPKKIKRLAMKSILSEKLLKNELIIIDKFDINLPETKKIKNILKNIKSKKTSLIITLNKDENIINSTNNLKGIKTTFSGSVNVYDIIKHESLIITKEAVFKLEEVLSNA